MLGRKSPGGFGLGQMAFSRVAVELTGIPSGNPLICIFAAVWGTPARTGWRPAFHPFFFPLGLLSCRAFTETKHRPNSFFPSLFYLLPTTTIFPDMFGKRKKGEQNNVKRKSQLTLGPHLRRPRRNPGLTRMTLLIMNEKRTFI